VLVADEDGASTPELISFDVFGRVVPQYIVYCLLGSFTNRAINMRSYGVKMPRIDMGFMANMPIPIPPISEQKYIVKKLESAFLLIDTIDAFQKKYVSNEKALKSKLINAGIQGWLTEQLSKEGDAEKTIANILKNKKEMQKKGVIKKSKPLPAITDKDIPFKIPANWKWVRLDDITTKITSGNTPVGGRKSNVYVEKGNCFFREQNIYNDGIHQEGMVYITDELLNTRKNSTVIAKDILLNITGGSIGRCALIPDDFSRGSINQHILIIRMVDERMRFYVHMFLCSAYAQKLIKYKAVGDKDGFSAGKCKQMLIPLPPIPEQQRIVKKINDYLSIMSLVSKQF
jgi:type I restriction enzyme S subunit